MNDVLSTPEVARLLGVHRATAYRWLLRLEKEHGTAVVARIGRKLFTTRTALAAVAPPLAEENAPRASRLDEVEARLDRTVTRVNDLAARLRALGRPL